MPVSLSIKNVPDELADRLRKRAASSHRSLQGELMAILEEAVSGRQPLSVNEVRERIREIGLESPDEAAEMIRADRDGR